MDKGLQCEYEQSDTCSKGNERHLWFRFVNPEIICSLLGFQLQNINYTPSFCLQEFGLTLLFNKSLLKVRLLIYTAWGLSQWITLLSLS